MSVDINETASGGFSQDNGGGEFDQGQVPGGNATAMKLVWSKGIVDGEVASATATFTAAAGAFAGQPFCAGAGTQVVIPTDTSKASIQFVLDSLASGDGCGVAHTGSLQGCMN
jgi:hypothetical protein